MRIHYALDSKDMAMNSDIFWNNKFSLVSVHHQSENERYNESNNS